MDININTPALLFPAVSLIMLAYTNRFLALASVVRNLHDRYHNMDDSKKPLIHAQIKNLRIRMRIIRNMQILGVSSFIIAIVCMYVITLEKMETANFLFASSLVLFAVSLILSLWELFISTRSIEIELSDLELDADD
jgi:magnesium-transporting ATPase (P-type)